MITLFMLFLACYTIGYRYQLRGVIILKNGDCFFEKNHLGGIQLVEYYSIKYALNVHKTEVAKLRILYFIDAHDAILADALEHCEATNRKTIQELRNEISHFKKSITSSDIIPSYISSEPQNISGD